MVEIINNMIDIMFSGFFSFIGMMLVLLVISSMFQFVYEKTLDFIQGFFIKVPKKETQQSGGETNV
jgi:hypothetical protein